MIMLRNLKITIFVILCVISLILTAISASSTLKINIPHIKQNIGSEFLPPDIIEMIQQVNKSKLRKHIQTIEDFGPHKTGSEALVLVGEYIYNELVSTNLSVEYIEWINNGFSGKNIVATLQGIKDKASIIIVCAHYDSVEVSPGADDDGSGVAIVMMLAEIMSSYSFNSTIKFILFSGEEQGKLGSTIYAKEAKNNGDNIVGVLALDKVGYAVTAEEGCKVVHHSNVESDWMVDISSEMAKKYYDYIGLEILRWSQDPGSDHLAFVDEGYHGTDFVRFAVNPFYHTSEDKVEHMNMTYLTKVCNLTLATLFKIAGLNSGLKNDDLKIVIKGTLLSNPAQIYVKIENKGHEIDTANVTIHICLKHIFRDKYVSTEKEHYDVPCNWSLIKEIGEHWEFLVGAHTFTKGLFKLKVVVQGIDDDKHLYKKEVTYGFVFNFIKVRLMPRL
jgi:hypothetical protein